jgi:septum site-determining protein MinC
MSANISIKLKTLELDFVDLYLPMIIVNNRDLSALLEDLKKLQTSFADLKNMNVALDLTHINNITNNELTAFYELFKSLSLNIVDIKTDNLFLQEQNIIFKNLPKKDIPKKEIIPSIKDISQLPNCEIHTGHVRSGQQIYSKQDVVILGSVSADAEVLSNGNVYIFGSLQGKALAGIEVNNLNAHIFCLKMQAQLVSVAGFYLTSENLTQDVTWNKATHISLQEQNLFLKKFNI